MSYADKVFVEMCQDIIENGVSTEGEKVRPKWEDGAYAYTIKKFGVTNRYDLSKEFPALTLRKTALKSCMDEILWIWQRKSNNIHDLKPHVWDEWADEDGSIGKAYGYQLGVKHQYKEGMMDQVDRVIYDLKNNPYSRRIMTNIYVHQDLHEMNLYPCAYSMTFNVTQKPGEEKLVLNAILNQNAMITKEFCDLKERELQNKINTQGDIITQLRGQISNDKQTEAFNAAMRALDDKIDAIAAKQPNTVPVAYPNLTAVNNTPVNNGSNCGCGSIPAYLLPFLMGGFGQTSFFN